MPSDENYIVSAAWIEAESQRLLDAGYTPGMVGLAFGLSSDLLNRPSLTARRSVRLKDGTFKRYKLNAVESSHHGFVRAKALFGERIGMTMALVKNEEDEMHDEVRAVEMAMTQPCPFCRYVTSPNGTRVVQCGTIAST